MSAPDPWAAHLAPGERLLWQGAPLPGTALRAHEWPNLLGGLGVMALALWWLATMDEPERLRPWGVALLLLGVVVALGTVVLNRHARQTTLYAVSSRGALILARPLPGLERLRRYPVGPGTVVEHDGRHPGSVWFASERRQIGTRRRTVKIGFHRIADAEAAMAALASLRGAAA